MKRLFKYLMFSSFVLLVLNGCNLGDDGNHIHEDIFQYKGSLIGDNSAVTQIIGQLRHPEEFNGVSLETKEEPYGMTIKYKDAEGEISEKEDKKTAIYNATFLFVLINNVDWIVFDFGHDQYEIMRSDLEDWYDKNINQFANENDLENFINEKLTEEDKINDLFTE